MNGTRFGAGILAGTLLLVLSIGCEGVRAPANAGSTEWASSPSLEQESPDGLESPGEVSAADRQAIFATLEAREYWASADGESVQAPNRRHDLRSHFEPTGVRVETRSGSEGPLLVELRLARLGRGEEFVAVGPGEIRHEAERVEIARPELGLVEWFENSPDGLEQGFTLAERPFATEGSDHRAEASTPLVVEVAVSGATASLAGDSIRLATASGRQLSYGHLVTRDANGTELASHFEVPSANRVRVVVDEDREAVYPIVIDPLLTETADAVIERNATGAGFSDVASAGDVNGDGYEDLIVGSTGTIVSHVAYIFHGSAAGVASGGPAQANTILSATTTTRFGQSVASAGDVNGDGYDDVIIGAYQTDAGQGSFEGAAYVFLGGPAGIPTGNVSTAAARLEGDQASADFGFDVASAGDVNGDGFDDVIVGARRYDSGQTDEGAAFLFLGSASGIANGSSGTASARLESDQASADFGRSVASAGDVNADGYADVIVGAPRYSSGQTNEGTAYIFLGSPSGIANGHPGTAATTLQSDQAASGGGNAAGLGGSVASAGDVDGDGYSDVIVGATGYDYLMIDEGAVFIFRGGPAGIANGNPSTAATFLVSGQGGSSALSPSFGFSVCGAGDANDDGYADVVVGARFFDDSGTDQGATFVWYGGSTGIISGSVTTSSNRTLRMSQVAAAFGTSAALAGDLDGDGFDDVVVSAPNYDAGQTDEGAAFVYRGGFSGILDFTATTTVPSVRSNQAGASFGYSVASAGDVNADGYTDVIVGAPSFDQGESDEGAAFIFHGAENGLSPGTFAAAANTVLESNQSLARLGSNVASAGDVNGDGYADVIVGASRFDNGEVDEGAAFVFLGSALGIASGNPSTAHARLESNQASASFGYSASSAGDVNGDGYSDVLVSAPSYDSGTVDEGAVFVFHGSATGISHGGPATAAAMIESDQGGSGGVLLNALFGASVAPAGDVDADGFGDILIGSPGYESGHQDEGSAFLFLGSATGIGSGNPTTASTRFEANVTNAWLGIGVASAGDVNADGYGDVIMGASGFSDLAGFFSADPVAYVYHGSSIGITSGDVGSANGELALESRNGGNGSFTVTVASAGDVDADGYGDVVVADQVVAPFAGFVGAAFVHRGSAGGVGDRLPRFAHAQILELAGPPSVFDEDIAASAGDFNGDGHGDLIFGAADYFGEGAAWIRSGNNGGRALRIRQLRSDGSDAPFQPGGSSFSTNAVKVELFAPLFPDRERAKLEVEVCPLGSAFGAPACLHHVGASWESLGATGAVLQETVSGLAENSVYAWRVRILATALSAPPPPNEPPPHVGPWYRLQARSDVSDFRTAVPEVGVVVGLACGVGLLAGLKRRRTLRSDGALRDRRSAVIREFSGKSRMLTVLGSLLVLSILPGAARAADGVREINQACVAVGCVTGDAPGFPVTINEPGSYRLTSNLSPAPDINVNAIEIWSPIVSLDLGGFSIIGPTTYGGGPGTCSGGSGIGILAISSVPADSVVVTNGMVRGMGFHAVVLQSSSRVDRVIVERNCGAGITVGFASTVIDSVARSNGGNGFVLDRTSRISDSISDYNGGNGIRNLNGDVFVQGCTANANAGDGINVGPRSMVRGNIVNINSSDGIEAGQNSSVVENSVANNTLFGIRNSVTVPTGGLGLGFNNVSGHVDDNVPGGGYYVVGCNRLGINLVCPP